MPQSMREPPHGAGWSQGAQQPRPEAQPSVQPPLPSAAGGVVNPLKQTFSPRERHKMDQDLSLLSRLSQALKSAHGSLLVVDFGYAVEALCAGVLTRYHHDLDVRLLVPLEVLPHEVVHSALRILNEHSDCAWQLYLDEAYPSWVALCGGDPHELLAPRCDMHLLQSEKPVNRAEEIEVISRQGQRYRLPLQTAWLQEALTAQQPAEERTAPRRP